jgi:hypothetical protein
MGAIWRYAVTDSKKLDAEVEHEEPSKSWRRKDKTSIALLFANFNQYFAAAVTPRTEATDAEEGGPRQPRSIRLAESV